MLSNDGVPGLSSSAEALAAEKPFAWEYRLFSRVLYDEMLLARQVQAESPGSAIGQPTLSRRGEVKKWVSRRLDELKQLMKLSDALLNVELAHAVGAPGEAGDVREIVGVARRHTEVYRQVLRWTAEVQGTAVDPKYARLHRLLSGLSSNMIQEMEVFATTANGRLEAAVADYERTHRPATLEMKLTITCPDTSELDREIRRLAFGWWG